MITNPYKLVLQCLLLFLVLTNNSFAHSLSVNTTDTKGRQLKNVVVYMEALNKSASSNNVTQKISIKQKKKKFLPFISVIKVGTNIDFPNLDRVKHHVYSFSPAKTFELKLYSGRPTKSISFNTPGTVTLGCNIHDNMLAFVHVVDTNFFGITDETGSFNINNLPTGDYLLKAWHYSEENVIQELKISIPDTKSMQLQLDIDQKSLLSSK